ncbi:MAG: AtpZ/AtpI family protein [Desulfovibrio sp.]|nr:AtpZ/AtpI family protein [Desulfovibrio sp.]
MKQFAYGGQSPPAPVSRQGFALQILAEQFTRFIREPLYMPFRGDEEKKHGMGLAKFFNITDRNYLDNLSLAGTIGLHMVSSVAVGVAIGYGLDYWLETYPWCSGIFMLLGIAAGFKNVYVDAKKLAARQEQESKEKGDEQK